MNKQLTFDDIAPAPDKPRPDPPPPEQQPPRSTARRCAGCGRPLRSLFERCPACENLPAWLV